MFELYVTNTSPLKMKRMRTGNAACVPNLLLSRILPFQMFSLLNKTKHGNNLNVKNCLVTPRQAGGLTSHRLKMLSCPMSLNKNENNGKPGCNIIIVQQGIPPTRISSISSKMPDFLPGRSSWLETFVAQHVNRWSQVVLPQGVYHQRQHTSFTNLGRPLALMQQIG